MKKYTLVIVLIAAMSAAAAAQGAPSSANPCEAAGKKFCSASKTLREFFKCMDENKASLSAACRSRVDFAINIGKKFQEKDTACKADRDKFCKDLDKGNLKCLLRNKSKTTKACQKDLSDWRRGMSIAPAHLKEQAKEKIKAPPSAQPKK